MEKFLCKEFYSTDYLFGGRLTLKNGRIDKYQFDEGYCQATQYNATQDNFTFLYYDKDHLGNVRQVTKASNSNGTVVQTMNYYPYGGLMADISTNQDMQRFRFQGKELDRFENIDWNDHGARHADLQIGRWNTVDPLAEKYYNVSPYVYCLGNPVKFVDPDGCKPDSLAAALMSSLVYNTNPLYNDKLKDIGWIECHSYSSCTGFKSKLYRKFIGYDKNGNSKYEYSLAFAGTDTDNGIVEFLKDGITDLLNSAGIITPQYVEAIGAAFGAVSGMAKNSELTFVGHSLGGGLATLASKLTGKDAIIFNPASISGSIKDVANIASFFRSCNITQYRAYGDYVNAFQHCRGTPSSGKIHWVNTESIISHGIDDIIRTFLK